MIFKGRPKGIKRTKESQKKVKYKPKNSQRIVRKAKDSQKRDIKRRVKGK